MFHRKYLNSSAYEVEVLISDHEFVHNGCGMRLTSVAPHTDLCFSRANFQDEDITYGYVWIKKRGEYVSLYTWFVFGRASSM